MSDLTANASAPEPQRTAPRPEKSLDVIAVERRRSALTALAVVAALLVAFSIYAISDGGFSLYLQRCFDGATQGSLYGATALALVLVFRATRVINFAQGGLAMFGTYLAWEAHAHMGLGIGIAVLAAVIVSALGAGVVGGGLVRALHPHH